jgi:hypothetical protein
MPLPDGRETPEEFEATNKRIAELAKFNFRRDIPLYFRVYELYVQMYFERLGKAVFRLILVIFGLD